MHLPLNALRAFEAAARHLSLTRAAAELNVTQTAVSQQVRGLEDRLGVTLFRRLPRGLALTEEAVALLPDVEAGFGRIAGALERLAHPGVREVLAVGAVASFAVGWLLPRLPDFAHTHPRVDLRLATHNNRVDLAGEGLDCAIRFGNGAWHGLDADPVLDAPLAPVCAPALAARLRTPADAATLPLLRSYRSDEWARWFAACGLPAPPVARGPVFDTSLALAEAAAQGAGVALLPVRLFARALDEGRLVQPLADAARIDTGRYWLTRLQSRPETPALAAFRAWLLAHAR